MIKYWQAQSVLQIVLLHKWESHLPCRYRVLRDQSQGRHASDFGRLHMWPSIIQTQ